MEKLILYRGDLASDVLVAKIAEDIDFVPKSYDAIIDVLVEPDADAGELLPELEPVAVPGKILSQNQDAPYRIGVVTFSGYLTKTAMGKLVKLAEKYHLVMYDYGAMIEALEAGAEGSFLPFVKEEYSLYAYQIVVAGALCKKLGVSELYVPSHDEGQGLAIPDIAVLVKFARKTVIHSTNRCVDVVSPFSELSSMEIKKLAKKYGV